MQSFRYTHTEFQDFILNLSSCCNSSLIMRAKIFDFSWMLTSSIFLVFLAARANAQCGCCGCGDSFYNHQIASNCNENVKYKQGKAGPKGEPGATGGVGQKGEPSVSAPLDEVNTKIQNLEEAVNYFRDLATELKAANECYKKKPNYTYEITPREMDWFDARRYCQSVGGDLVVHGMKDFEVRLSIKDQFKGGSFWIGASDLDHEGVWKWVDGKLTSDDMHWATGQPDNSNSVEHCGCIVGHPSYSWGSNDARCNVNKIGICEITVKC